NTLYVADTWNDVIRRVNISGTAPYAEAAPVVSSVSPKEVNPAWDQGSGLQVKLTGSGFTYGAKTYFADFLADQTYVQTGTALAVKLPLSKLKPGWYDVTVVNLDGQRSTLERGLGITDSKGTTPSTYYPNSSKSSSTVSNGTTFTVAEGTSFMAYNSTLRGGFLVSSGNILSTGADEIVTGTDTGIAPEVRVLNGDGIVLSHFFAYPSSSRSGVRVNTCDVNGDGLDEIITVQGAGALPMLKIFNGSGTLLNSFSVLDGKFQGGVFLSCGDIDGNGTQEIVVAAARGGGAQVMVYDSAGKAQANFFAYAKSFRGGIRVATADMDDDGKDEIITGPDLGAPHIQIFKIKTNAIVRLSPGFFAFGTSYRGGVSVAGVDIDGDGKKELVVAVGNDAQPLVKIYNIREQLITQFYAFAPTFLGGVNVAGGDTNGDGVDELIVTPRSGGGPQVRVISVQ
ncbi:MAG: VCBS repeat-containing protein, partial [Patescibacteria group bacterium]